MSGRIEVVGVFADLLLGALLAAVSRENVFVVVKVVVVVLVKESFGHVNEFCILFVKFAGEETTCCCCF